MKMQNVIKLLSLVLMASLLSGILWAIVQESFMDAISRLLKEPWFLVTILDFYIGVIFVSIIIYIVEPLRWSIPLWVVSIILLGNIPTMLYLLLRIDRMINIFSSSNKELSD